jgi:peptidoglycan hydrolase-like protein with peptidoglycan-binding domain
MTVAPKSVTMCGVDPNFSTWPLLVRGSTGHQVIVLQCRLKTLGYSVTTSGTVDTATINAVNAFRASKGWAKTGATTRPLWTALLAVGSEPRVLKYGSVGQEVWRLQRALKAAGWDVSLNGFYNSKTAHAVASYRNAAGLAGYQTTVPSVWRQLKAGETGR